MSLKYYKVRSLIYSRQTVLFSAKECISSYLCFIDPPSGTDDAEAQLLEASKSGDLAAVERILQTNPHVVNCRDLDGRHSTPLHFAAGFNRVPVVEYLLAHGADVHAKDKGLVSFYTCYLFLYKTCSPEL